jgi:NAD(P)-dependent dehydrogenase (short-subunit alcohol dehydrogenase family)
MSLRAIVLGAGEGVGLSVVRKLKSEGYKVVAVSRNPNVQSAKDGGYHAIKYDLSNSEQLSSTFVEAEKELGGFPNVVVYNGMTCYTLPLWQ